VAWHQEPRLEQMQQTLAMGNFSSMDTANYLLSYFWSDSEMLLESSLRNLLNHFNTLNHNCWFIIHTLSCLQPSILTVHELLSLWVHQAWCASSGHFSFWFLHIMRLGHFQFPISSAASTSDKKSWTFCMTSWISCCVSLPNSFLSRHWRSKSNGDLLIKL
jgi:hypothetical protein